MGWVPNDGRMATAPKPYVESRRPHRQAGVNLRVSREQRDALRRVAERRGMTVTDYIVAKIAPDLRREMGA